MEEKRELKTRVEEAVKALEEAIKMRAKVAEAIRKELKA
jgi:hypothetical protein